MRSRYTTIHYFVGRVQKETVVSLYFLRFIGFQPSRALNEKVLNKKKILYYTHTHMAFVMYYYTPRAPQKFVVHLYRTHVCIESHRKFVRIS